MSSTRVLPVPLKDGMWTAKEWEDNGWQEVALTPSDLIIYDSSAFPQAEHMTVGECRDLLATLSSDTAFDTKGYSIICTHTGEVLARLHR